MKRFFVLTPADPAYPRVRRNFLDTLGAELAQGPREVIIQEPKRTSDQNALLWALLSDLSSQLRWPVNGEMQKLSPEDWKDLATAALKREQRVAAGIDGGFVMIGARTSSMSKRQFSELIELILAFGSERGVSWSQSPEEVAA